MRLAIAIAHDRYFNMVARLSGQTSLFGVVFFVSAKSPLGIERQKPRSHVRILIYRTWPIAAVISN